MNNVWHRALARRLDRHSLVTPAKADPADVVAGMCGAHAQVMSAAEWSIGLRLDGTGRDEIRHALWTDRSLVKTFGPRGTVHLLPTRDLPLWVGAFSRIPPMPSLQPHGIRMTPEQTEQVIAAIADILADTELTVDELTEAIVTATGPWAGDPVIPAFQGAWARWRQAVTQAAHRGVLCFGTNRGRNVTYTSPHHWSAGFTPADPVASAAELARRYLRSYGPATPAEFARWLGTPPTMASELFKSMDHELQPVELDGSTAWLVAGDDDQFPEPAGLRLLPYFDAYQVGSHPRGLVFPGRASERALSRGQAGNYQVLLIDGMVAGVWHQKRSGRKLHVTVEPLGRLSGVRRRALDDQVARLGEFLDARPELTIGTVTTGPHA